MKDLIKKTFWNLKDLLEHLKTQYTFKKLSREIEQI